jgi:IS30 family transposase
LVGHSPAGLYAGELSQKLHHPCHAVLSQLHTAGRLDRFRLSGQFRYLAVEPQLNRQQRQQATLAQAPSPTASLSTQTALWVLVEYIKQPGLSFEQIASRLQEQHHMAVAPESIERFFREHDLKKTPPARN